MTIQELYVFACKQDLLNKDIYEVINKFKTSSKVYTTNPVIEKCVYKNNEIEYTAEDVLELFS